MRLAVVSDIHGNRRAFEAVLNDLRQTSPDVVLHGGDLVGSGASSAEIVDQIRHLGWRGVMGNTDEMMARPESFEAFAGERPNLERFWTPIREMAAFEREALGDERIAWLGSLPGAATEGDVVVVHASPESAWSSPGLSASDEELESTYDAQGAITVYGHIHCAFARQLPHRLIVNSGSAGLSYDGDQRAAYVLLENGSATIRRVEYDVEGEVRELAASGLPHWEWIARTLRAAAPQLP